MALHAAQGPTLGVPQMIQTRGQFGSLGSLLVVGIVIVMYVGFLASNLVLSGEALASLVTGMSDAPGIAAGRRIERHRRHLRLRPHSRLHPLMTYVSGAVLVLTVVLDRLGSRFARGFPARNAFNLAGFLGNVSAAALWQIAYAPYVSDYSRYMPQRHRCAAGVLGELLGLHPGIVSPDGAGRDGWSRDAARQSDRRAGAADAGHCAVGA